MSQTLTITAEQVLASAERIREDIVRDRRTLHAAPEVGTDLPNTVACVKKRLLEMGYQPRELAGGVVAEITGTETGAQEQTAAGLGAGYLCDDTTRQLARLIAHLKQAFFDAGYSVRQVGADLGCSVQCPPVADNILSDALCRCKHLLRRYG